MSDVMEFEEEGQSTDALKERLKQLTQSVVDPSPRDQTIADVSLRDRTIRVLISRGIEQVELEELLSEVRTGLTPSHQQGAVAEVRSLIYLSAGLSGIKVSPGALELFADLVDRAFTEHRLDENRRPEAVSNLLHLIAEALSIAQQRDHQLLHVEDVNFAKLKSCPVYPFD